MCSVSATMDSLKWPYDDNPWVQKSPTIYPNTSGTPVLTVPPPPREISTGNPEYDKLLKTLDFPNKRICDFTADDFEKVINIVKICLKYDEEHGEPECVDPQKAKTFDDLITSCALKMTDFVTAGDLEKANTLAGLMRDLVGLKKEVTGKVTG